jgi:hypothetical protein
MYKTHWGGGGEDMNTESDVLANDEVCFMPPRTMPLYLKQKSSLQPFRACALR